MKIKMVKMGMDIDETRNHRIRGIVPTEDGKYLFVEIMEGRRPDKKYTSYTQKEYEKEYPNPEYIYFDSCFRVDIPEDYFKNYTQEYSDYDRKPLFEYAHTKENIVKVLQKFNKDIDYNNLKLNIYVPASRCFGLFKYKQDEILKEENQIISCVPEVNLYDINNIDYILLMTKGMINLIGDDLNVKA